MLFAEADGKHSWIECSCPSDAKPVGINDFADGGYWQVLLAAIGLRWLLAAEMIRCIRIIQKEICVDFPLLLEHVKVWQLKTTHLIRRGRRQAFMNWVQLPKQCKTNENQWFRWWWLLRNTAGCNWVELAVGSWDDMMHSNNWKYKCVAFPLAL